MSEKNKTNLPLGDDFKSEASKLSKEGLIELLEMQEKELNAFRRYKEGGEITADLINDTVVFLKTLLDNANSLVSQEINIILFEKREQKIQAITSSDPTFLSYSATILKQMVIKQINSEV